MGDNRNGIASRIWKGKDAGLFKRSFFSGERFFYVDMRKREEDLT